MKPLPFIFIILLCISLFSSVPPAAGMLVDNEEETGLRYSVNGRVKDALTGEELIGAAVILDGLGKGTVTNVYGFYSISMPPGFYQLKFSYIGYEPVLKAINLSGDQVLNIELNESIQELQEVTIRAEGPETHVRKAEMSATKLQIKSIKRIPTLMGEVDVIKAIQLLPGVQATSEGGSGFSVRGGNPDQNLILLDEATVYNASHLMGFFSVFNNDAVKDVKLYKGDIPADYGGRLSSLLDVRMKDGNMKKFSGSGGIGTIASRLTLEGPIIKDRTSFLIAGRRTYADVLFLPFAKDEDVRNSTLFFYDMNAKVNHIFNDKNRLFASAYLGRDVFGNIFARMAFGNQTYSLRWNHLFSGRLFSNFTLIHSRYDYELGTPDGEASSFTWNSKMKDYSVKADFNYYINPAHTLRFGGMSTFHDFKPGAARGLGEQSLFTEFILPSNYALENGVYFSAESSLGERWNFKYGLRFSSFHNTGPATVYNYDENYIPVDSTVYGSGNFYNYFGGFEPRLAGSFMLNNISSLKASYSRTRQYIQLAQNSTAGTPLDVWFPSSPNINPQISDQVALGYFRNLWGDRLEGSVEAYYKKTKNAIDFRDHASLLLNPYMEGEIRVGEGTSWGLEFLLRKNAGRLNGWISYTYSKTERVVPEINNGNAYTAPYDKPHDLAIVLNYEINKRIWVSGNWVYSTGLPVTFPTGRFEYMGNIAPVYSNRNSYRMPDYHRLDLSISFSGKVKPGRNWGWDLNLSAYNAYARKNAWTINFVQDDTNPDVTHAEMTYLFSIIPALTWNFHF